jgi:transcription elongation factor GreA
LSDVFLTRDGLEKLTAELQQLHGERKELSDRVGHALAAGGAFPENGDYLDARHAQEILERRIALLERRLHGAQVVDAAVDGEVDIGERVSVLDLTTAETLDYRIVGSGEGDPLLGMVAHDSPVGSALLGTRVGDVVEVDAPGGSVRLEVVEIDG